MSYRDNASQTSPTLEQLAEHTRATRRAGPPPTRVTDLGIGHELAVGVHDDQGSFGILAALLWLPVLGCIKAGLGQHGLSETGNVVLPIAVLVAVAATIAWFTSSENAERRRAAAIKNELAWATSQPFEVRGYATWLASEASIITVTLRRTVDKALFADAALAISRDIETTALDATTFSFKLPSRSQLVHRTTYRFGDVALVKQVFEKLLLPLHADVEIERVSMH